MSAKNKESNIIVAALTGGIIGAAFAILYAPQSGKLTRSKIKLEAETTARRLGSAATELGGDLSSRLEEGVEDFAYELGSIVARTAFSSEEVIQMLENKLNDLRANSKKKRATKRVKNIARI